MMPCPTKGNVEACFFKLNLCLGMKMDDGDFPEHVHARQDGKTKDLANEVVTVQCHDILFDIVLLKHLLHPN